MASYADAPTALVEWPQRRARMGISFRLSGQGRVAEGVAVPGLLIRVAMAFIGTTTEK